jgi:TolA-binding protein
MNGQNKYNDDNSWKDTLPADEDSALFGMISAYFKGELDIEEVKNDPAYADTNDKVKKMIAGYQNNATHNKDNEKFIRDSFSGETNEGETEKEISGIKQEISHSNLDNVSADWVKDWHEKRQGNGRKDAETAEIRDFITGSLKHAGSMTEINIGADRKKRLIRRLITSYAMLAAAALMGAVFLVRSLLPSYNPDKIFSKYYEPFYTLSPVTRSLIAGGNERYTSALESYKNGNYPDAATGFSEAMLTDEASVSLSFFLGITQIALKDYGQAIKLFDGVVNRQGEYAKEARWYMGLAYIKAGNKAKASECFELLAQSSGFYRERSERILRRLK